MQRDPPLSFLMLLLLLVVVEGFPGFSQYSQTRLSIAAVLLMVVIAARIVIVIPLPEIYYPGRGGPCRTAPHSKRRWVLRGRKAVRRW